MYNGHVHKEVLGFVAFTNHHQSQLSSVVMKQTEAFAISMNHATDKDMHLTSTRHLVRLGRPLEFHIHTNKLM